jgi:Tol biopolymer transport system component
MSEERAAAAPRAGSRIGAYEILGKLGAGGMGEVYRARDTRLERNVALKILPETFASDPGKARRFEKEARAASALNHPNIVTVYEVGREGDLSYIAMELVEGKTLRESIVSGPLPLKPLLDLACQIASGLGRAHEAGIVHRDLKPENVMISRDGLVKILDFGLAKRMPFEGGAGSVEATQTQEGAVVGTVGYMSPEQAAGKSVDYRSDQFSFGSILYEMAAGRRAFQSKSAVETLAAIINLEPEPIEITNPRVPGPLRWIVARCLSKDPAARYASTQDLAQELKVARDHIAEMSDAFAPGPAVSAPRRTRFFAAIAAAAVLAGFVGVFLASRRADDLPIPDYLRLTFSHGSVATARFAPDGRTVVYAASFDGDPARLFSTRTDGRESRRLEFPDGVLASMSSQGEIAMLLSAPRLSVTGGWAGTLARVPLTGGTPRELTEGVSGADWSSDGKTLAIVRSVGNKTRLEFPIGKVLYETADNVTSLRLSPDGKRIALLTSRSADDFSVETVDLEGRHSVLSKGWKRGRGIAWSPDGEEVWFAASDWGNRVPLRAVSRKGKVRLVMRLPDIIVLQDVARDGRALVSLMTPRFKIRGLFAGDKPDRDLSWHEGSLAKDLTPDGRTILFDEAAEGDFRSIYVRGTDGSPAKLLGDGRSLAISHDGRWVATNAKGRGSEVVLLPTGAGEPRTLNTEGHRFAEAAFFPDGKRILLVTDGGPVYAKDLPDGRLLPVAPVGTLCKPISPDGKETACTGPKGEGVIYPVAGGTPRPIPGFQAGDEPQHFSSDGLALYVGRFRSVPMKIVRLDLATGKREILHEFTPEDPATLSMPLYYFAMTPDGKSYAYSALNISSDLYLVTGLR